uniref:Uncharacterized protein n=1 Tax=Cucumis melo TaxID=3656 RepID=A0A9I9D3Y1_CUCME
MEIPEMEEVVESSSGTFETDDDGWARVDLSFETDATVGHNQGDRAHNINDD